MKKQRKPDRRIRRTRRQLHKALHQLLKERAYSEISVSDIVDEADISRATFYLHYDDKDELLIHSLEILTGSLLDTLKSLSTDDLLLITIPIFEHITQHQQLYQTLLKNKALAFAVQPQLETLIDLYQPYITDALSSNSDSDPNLITHQLVGALYAMILWWLKHSLTPSATQMAQQFTDFANRTIQVDRT